MTRLPDATLVDVNHLGRERVIGCWDLGGALVDPGPESSLARLLEGIGEEPRSLLLTHIHLDHAGASGALVERFPDLEVWVHERGAPHLADPARLLRSAQRLYGDEMERLWGRVVPVPEQNLRVLEGGEVIEVAGRKIEVTYAPGHAWHHVVYFDRGDRTAYVGDVGGVRISPADFILPPTPPPDVDVEAWRRSLDAVAAMPAERLALTHFGAVDAVPGHLARMAERLAEQASEVREMLAREGDEQAARSEFVASTLRRIEAGVGDADTARVYSQASRPDQLWQGLARYWRNRASALESELTLGSDAH
jgi:glyoxylase-like metal-dependent hydrolase (beta-lactamase superfamily II)